VDIGADLPAGFCDRRVVLLIEWKGSRRIISGFWAMADKTTKRSFWRAFVDFFVLFSGISTASNLERTQGRPLWTRGIFLFRPKRP
jgi:hypothetical protein